MPQIHASYPICKAHALGSMGWCDARQISKLFEENLTGMEALNILHSSFYICFLRDRAGTH